jgi:pimeloyl-ACP methyl ester carboxylesterase
MYKIMQLFLLSVITLIILLFIGVSYQNISTKYDNLRYPSPGRFIEIDDTKIHYLCTGRNGPIIILDAGLGADLNWWSLVQNETSKFARVLSFDRPGYGWSDTGKEPRTSGQIISELHNLLRAIELTPPYVLVGHSFGGVNMRLYANTYPEEVIALILVDACHEDQNFEENISSRSVIAKFKNYLCNSTFSHYNGISRWFMVENLEPFFSSLMSQELRDLIIAKASSVKALRARDNEMVNLKESLFQIKRSKNTLLNKPLIVITAEETNKDPQWQKYQKKLVSLSNKCKQIIAKKSSHMVNVDRPEVIISAIKEVIELNAKF